MSLLYISASAGWCDNVYVVATLPKLSTRMLTVLPLPYPAANEKSKVGDCTKATFACGGGADARCRGGVLPAKVEAKIYAEGHVLRGRRAMGTW